jgi:outer membrane receptor for ferrienterochelin and colicins
MIRKLVLLSLMIAMAEPLLSQQSEGIDSLVDMSLEQLLNVPVSVASKSDQSLDTSPGTVRVISRQQIVQTNARTLKDVLNIFIPGMDATPNSFKYDDRGEFFFNRGIYTDFSQQVLILFNGMNKLSESTFGSPFVAMDITLEWVDHIEVSSTPAPVQGGSAITTINIITRDTNMDGVEVQANVGVNTSDFYQSNKLSGVMGKTTKAGWHLGSSFQLYSDKGQAHRLPQGNGGFAGGDSLLRDGIKNASNVTFNAESPNKKLKFGSWYKVTNKDAFLSGLTPSQSSNPYNYQGKVLQNYLSYSPTAQWTVSAGSSNYYFENFYSYGGPTGYNNVNYDYFVESLHKAKLKDHYFVYGTKLQFEGQSSSDTYVWNNTISAFSTDKSLQVAPNGNRTIVSIFAEDNWSISSKLNLIAGARYDNYHSFGNTKFSIINPRITAIYSVTPNFIVKVLHASSFRPPAIYDVLGNGIPPLVGQSTVKPEVVRMTEASLMYKTGKVRISAVGYLSDFQKGIVFSQKNNVDPNFYAGNQENKKILGTEIDMNFQISRSLNLFLNGSKLTYLKQITPTYFLPTFYLNGGTNLKISNFNFNLTSYYRGKRSLPDNQIVNKLYAERAQFNCNLSVSYQFKGVKVYTLVENLLNGDYYMPLSADGFLHPLRLRVINIGTVIKF